ncbi:bacteriocin fulvocin C-related protein [Nocardiopsis alba]|uniref:bacteriocin fulvocin C-related protein n=1 Tax=Nocardiopsis alba TaxID=53437 RepID=UPI0037F8173D
MKDVRARYVLAFDASCERCANISAAVAAVSEGRLETLPLTHPDVRSRRTRQWGPTAPWVPTLIRLGGSRERCWKGASMIPPLVLGLGARATLRVLETLGEVSRARRPLPAEERPCRLSRLATGARAALVMALGRRTPPLARSDHALAREWVEAHRTRLPTDYDAFVSHPLVRRRLMFAELAPERRRDLWLEHLRRYEWGHPELTPEQRAALDLALVTLSEARVFREGLPPETERLLRRRAVAAFGPRGAHALLATLGPDEPGPGCAAVRALEREGVDPPEGSWEPCLSKGCAEVPFTCGTAWVSTHDGGVLRSTARVGAC